MSRTVLIVDDHATFRSRCRQMLEAAGYRVVGESEDAKGALTDARRLRPEIVLLDVQLPDGNGFDVADDLAADTEGPAVVMISSRRASEYRGRLRRSPACGFIAKDDLSGSALAGLLGERG
ncbi:MAG: response regulator transcription factor [Actinomycetota bacterium]